MKLKVFGMLLLSMFLVACGKSDNNADITIAYQYGMAYAPIQVMKEQKLIEKYYPDVEINWLALNSGSAITEGMIANNIDVGAMGVAPAITAISKGVPCKIFSALSSQPNMIMCNDSRIQSLSDIGKDDKIALVNMGSIQHILLSMAAEKELGDPHALDTNILAMSHADGMTSLISKSVSCQVTTSPYIFKEEKYDNIFALPSIAEVWPEGNTFIVALATNELHEKNPELYNAVTYALADAIDYINANPTEVAKMLCEKEDVSYEEMLSWLLNPSCRYSVETAGIMEMAEFMERTNFIENACDNYSDYVYENVKGN